MTAWGVDRGKGADATLGTWGGLGWRGKRGGEHGEPVCVCVGRATITPFYFKSHVLSIKDAKVGNSFSMPPWLPLALTSPTVHFTPLLPCQTGPLHPSTSLSDLSTPLLPCQTCPLHSSTSLSDLSTTLIPCQTCPLHLSTSPVARAPLWRSGSNFSSCPCRHTEIMWVRSDHVANGETRYIFIYDEQL